jgi:trehalose-6-phosphate synthase
MRECRQVDPELVPISTDPEHLQACHLDEATKDREAAKLLEATMGKALQT